MTVTLTPADLIYPSGELTENLFPDGKINDHVTLWLSQAAANAVVAAMADADANDAATHYVYWRSYAAHAQRVAVRPTSETTQRDTQRTYSDGRVKTWMDLANEHKAAWQIVTTPALATSGGLFGFGVAKGRRC